MPGEIQRLEIFSAGTHKTGKGQVSATVKDLDKMIEAFDALKDTNIVKPHLKLGHTDAQKWFGQADGIPALGWITEVWREGKILLANIDKVPGSLIDLIKQGRFHNVSAEIFWDAPIEKDGTRFSRVLAAVALLGVEMPAVKDLAGLAQALFQSGEIHEFTSEDPREFSTSKKEPVMPDPTPNPAAAFTQAQVDALIEAAVDKAVKAAKKEFATESESIKAELKVADERAKEAEAETKKVRLSATQAQAETLVDAAIKDGKILPKQKEFALAMLSQTSMVKFGDGEKTMTEVFSEFLESSGKVIETKEKGNGKLMDPKKDPTEFATVSEEVDHKTKEYAETHKLSYPDANRLVLEHDADLKKRYAGTTS